MPFLSPGAKAEPPCLLDVHIVRIEEVFMGRTAEVESRVGTPRPEDHQSEKPDGESTPQVSTVRDLTGIQQLVAMVISQGSGFLKAVHTCSVEPNN